MVSKTGLKFIRSLKNKKYRSLEKCFLVEGHKNVEELLRSDFTIRLLVATQSYWNSYHDWLKDLPAEEIKEAELQKITGLVTHQDVLAVVDIPDLGSPDLDKTSLLLDGVRDPGNLGTITRTWDWFGFDQLLCTEDTVEFYNPKVIAATMGSFTRVKPFYIKDLGILQNLRIPIIGTTLTGERLDTFTPPDKAIWVMGSESHGIRPEIKKHLNASVTIPGTGRAESLNVAIAAGILSYKIASF
jgi:TrmH family RNA methyltransferase